MDIIRKSFICGALFVAVLFTAGLLLPKEEPRNPEVKLRVGAGDDISGLFSERWRPNLKESLYYLVTLWRATSSRIAEVIQHNGP